MENGEKIQNILREFKNLTVNLIEDLEVENYNSLDNIIEQRNILLDKLINKKYTKEDINKATKDLQIRELNHKLSVLLQSNMNKIKQNLEDISKSKVANNMYNNVYKTPNIFSKKV